MLNERTLNPFVKELSRYIQEFEELKECIPNYMDSDKSDPRYNNFLIHVRRFYKFIGPYNKKKCFKSEIDIILIFCSSIDGFKEGYLNFINNLIKTITDIISKAKILIINKKRSFRFSTISEKIDFIYLRFKDFILLIKMKKK